MMKICLISNVASHYRAPIYQLIDQVYDAFFYFSEPFLDIKRMDYGLLKHPVVELKTWHWHNLSFQHGVFSLLDKNYARFIALGDVRSISTWLFLIKAKIIRKPVYLWTHGWYGKESKVEALIKKVFYRLPKGVLLYGNYAKGLMINEGIDPTKLHVIYNSLDHSKQLAIRNELRPSGIYTSHFRNEKPTIIVICRLTARKRIDLLIKALSILKDNGSIYNLVIIGDGTENNKLQSLVETEGLTNQVWFYGACYDERTNAELIFNSDLCVTPGDVGLTAIHVMMFGVPVITHHYYPSQGPEFEAIHPNITGNFFERDNVDSLVNTIDNWFLCNNHSREAIRNACYQEIDEKWNPNYQIRVIQSALE